jgi:hypothetical protein
VGVGGQRAARLYLRLATLLLATAGILVVLGWRPTSSLGGIAAIRSMLAGCGVSFLASLIGAVPVIRSERGYSAHSITTLMGSMLLRITAAAALTVVAALQGLFESKPLILWVGISYLAFLPADLYIALKAKRATDD